MGWNFIYKPGHFDMHGIRRMVEKICYLKHVYKSICQNRVGLSLNIVSTKILHGKCCLFRHLCLLRSISLMHCNLAENGHWGFLCSRFIDL